MFMVIINKRSSGGARPHKGTHMHVTYDSSSIEQGIRETKENCLEERIRISRLDNNGRRGSLSFSGTSRLRRNVGDADVYVACTAGSYCLSLFWAK